MNYSLFFFILNLILISRLCFTLRDSGVNDIPDLLYITFIPLAILPFLKLNIEWFILGGFLLIMRPLYIRAMEKNTDNLNRNRIITLAITVVITMFLNSTFSQLKPADWVSNAEHLMYEMFIPKGEPGAIHWLHLNILLFGLLMILNEMNILTRFTLEKLKLPPLGDEDQKINEDQFRTGRVIGFLERIFVFLFVLSSQYTAIGFIIAAKGIVRYPDFGGKTYTEYILIGTLLSVLCAMSIAYFVLLFLT